MRGGESSKALEGSEMMSSKLALPTLSAARLKRRVPLASTVGRLIKERVLLRSVKLKLRPSPLLKEELLGAH